MFPPQAISFDIQGMDRVVLSVAPIVSDFTRLGPIFRVFLKYAVRFERAHRIAGDGSGPESADLLTRSGPEPSPAKAKVVKRFRRWGLASRIP